MRRWSWLRSGVVVVLSGCQAVVAVAQDQGARIDEIRVLLPETVGHWVGGVTADRIGNVYVADFQERVWKIDTKGDVTVFADEMYGASGNTIDPHGNLLQSNFYANTISKITRAGEVSTLVSEGLNGPVGLAMKPDDAGIYVANCRGQNILRVVPGEGAEVWADGELFACPNGVAFASDGSLYVVNFSNNKMVRVAEKGAPELFVELTDKGLGHLSFLREAFYVTAFHSHEIYQVTLEGETKLLLGTGEPGVSTRLRESIPLAWPNGITAQGWNGTLNLVINESLNPSLLEFPRRTTIRHFVFKPPQPPPDAGQ